MDRFNKMCTRTGAHLSYLKLAIILMIAAVIHILFVQNNPSQLEELHYLRDIVTRLYERLDIIQQNRNYPEQSEIKEMYNKLKEATDEPLLKYKDLRMDAKQAQKSFEEIKNHQFDKTGRPDLALENSGGRILNYGASKLIYAKDCTSFLKITGFCEALNPPKKAVQPSMHFGECFCFYGTRGTLLIRLAMRAVVDTVVLEHISPKMSPDGDVSSAPKDFSVMGLEHRNDENPFHFGNFTFHISTANIKSFKFPKVAPTSHELVQIDFFTNHGNKEVTCVYRVRVHGEVLKE